MNAATSRDAENIGFGTNPRRGRYIVSRCLLLMNIAECMILRLIFTQLPKIKPTGPNQVANRYDAPKNAIDS